MTSGADNGRLPTAYLVPGSSSFTEFLSAQAPDAAAVRAHAARRARRSTPRTARRSSPLTYAGGVVMAGDRRATMGNLIANRDMEKVFATDEYSLVGIAGTAGLAIELVRLFQVELEHYEKIEGTLMSLEGKANRLASMIRGNLGMAMQGLSVVPLFAGFDADTGIGRIFSYDVTGGCYEEHDHHSVGSGSLFARGSLKKLYRRAGTLDDAVRTAVEALYDAADDDSATGGPDVGRRIWPTIGIVDDDGARFVPDDEIAPVVDAIIASRVDNPGGAR